MDQLRWEVSWEFSCSSSWDQEVYFWVWVTLSCSKFASRSCILSFFSDRSASNSAICYYAFCNFSFVDFKSSSIEATLVSISFLSSSLLRRFCSNFTFWSQSKTFSSFATFNFFALSSFSAIMPAYSENIFCNYYFIWLVSALDYLRANF